MTSVERKEKMDHMMSLIQEIGVLKLRFQPQATGHLHTAGSIGLHGSSDSSLSPSPLPVGHLRWHCYTAGGAGGVQHSGHCAPSSSHGWQ